MLDLISRFHPLVIHLPIGILAMVYLLEMRARIKKDRMESVHSFVLLMAGITATLSILTGLLLVRDGDYSGDLVFNHKWAAIALGVVCWGLYFFNRSSKTKLYTWTLLVSGALLAYTGHMGGSITHGEDFLLGPQKAAPKADLASAVLYTDVVHPIFEEKCISCHNASKLKGELNMSKPELLLKGGENGTAILVDQALESLLWKRINLHPSAEEHMPPEGKKQLTEDEIVILEWWLKDGADFEKLLVETDSYEEHKELVEKYLAPPEVDIFTNMNPPDSAILGRLSSKGIKLYPISSGSAAVYVNFSNRQDLKSSDFKALRKIKDNISHLNLASTNLSDDLVSSLGMFENLQKLEIQNTEITSKGIERLKDFSYLKTLNAYGTRIDSSVLATIIDLPQLQNIYLWKTDFKPANVESLLQERPLLNVVYNVNQEFLKDARLRPPFIRSETEIFIDSMEVELDISFKDVDILYAVNGGAEKKYEGPFNIYKTSEIVTYAKKAGWESSEKASKTLIMKGLKIEDVKLHNQPHKKYVKYAGAKLLNNVVGGRNYDDGQWIGYEGSHARMTIQLDKTSDVTELTLGALESTGSYIFYPKAIKVSLSEGGKKFKEVASESYAIVEEPSIRGRKNFTLKFEKSKARWVKVDVLSHLSNPDWHSAPGAKNWIFIDELIVN